jgi:ribosomal protein S18 acetylase RimI-like enzyme
MTFLKRKKVTLISAESVIVRQLRKGDLQALEWNGEFTHFRRLYRQSFESANRGRSVLWVIEYPGKGIIGQLFVQLESGRKELADGSQRAYIYAFRVQPAYRNHGIGTSVLLFVEKDLRARGFKSVTLNVNRENAGARRLYEHLGYQVVADEPGIWSYIDHEGRTRHVNEPSWRMEKTFESD